MANIAKDFWQQRSYSLTIDLNYSMFGRDEIHRIPKCSSWSINAKPQPIFIDDIDGFASWNNFYYRKHVNPYPNYRKVIILIFGYLTPEDKETLQKAMNMVIHLQIRQRIVPRLEYEVSFYTDWDIEITTNQ